MDTCARMFAELHERNKKALTRGEFVLSHEITRQIQQLLFDFNAAITRHRLTSDQRYGSVSYCLRPEPPWTWVLRRIAQTFGHRGPLPESLRYASDYPGPLPESLQRIPNQAVVMWKREEERRRTAEERRQQQRSKKEERRRPAEERRRKKAEEKRRRQHAERQHREEEWQQQLLAAKALRREALERGVLIDGDRCPRCHFSYAWTGNECGHCKFQTS